MHGRAYNYGPTLENSGGRGIPGRSENGAAVSGVLLDLPIRTNIR